VSDIIHTEDEGLTNSWFSSRAGDQATRVKIIVSVWGTIGAILLALVLITFARPGEMALTTAFLGSVFLAWILLSFVGGGGYLFYREMSARLSRLEDMLSKKERASILSGKGVQEELSRQVMAALEKPLARLDDSLSLMHENVKEIHLQNAAEVTWFESLYHIFQLLSEAETDEQLYEHIVTSFAILDGYTQVVLLLGRDELGPLYLVAGLGLTPDILAEWKGRPWRPPLWGVVAPALAKSKPFSAYEDPTSERSFKEEFPWPVQGNSITAIPLKGMEGVQGVVLLAQSGDMRRLTQVQMRLLDIVAIFAGHTLESRQLARGVHTHITELVTLQSIARAMVSAPSMDALVKTLGAEISTVVGPSSVAVVLNDEDLGMQVYYASPLDSEDEQAKEDIVDWRVVNWVLEAGQPLFFNPGQVGDDVGDLMFESAGQAMAVPLEGHDQILGVLLVVSQVTGEVFEEPQLVGVRTIANAAVVGLYAIRYRSLME